LEELIALSDRIAVIYGGQIMGIVQPEAFDIGEIGLMMTGTPQSKLQAEPV
jgi:simple sugar transport system ATP-binding protein